jgi:hypothetical protein
MAPGSPGSLASAMGIGDALGQQIGHLDFLSLVARSANMPQCRRRGALDRQGNQEPAKAAGPGRFTTMVQPLPRSVVMRAE